MQFLCSITNVRSSVPIVPPSRRAQRQSIGIGGHLAMPPLPHHRAYGSVPRRFGGLSAHQLLHGDQAETTEASFGEGAMQSFREAQPPGTLGAENGRTGRPFGDLEPTELTIALTARLPLDPSDATQAPSDPAIQRWQLVPLAEAEVAGPTPHERVQVGNHLLQADAPVPRVSSRTRSLNRVTALSAMHRRNAGSSLTVKSRNDRCQGRATALFSALICSLRRPSMKRVRLAMTRRPAFSLRT